MLKLCRFRRSLQADSDLSRLRFRPCHVNLDRIIWRSPTPEFEGVGGWQRWHEWHAFHKLFKNYYSNSFPKQCHQRHFCHQHHDQSDWQELFIWIPFHIRVFLDWDSWIWSLKQFLGNTILDQLDFWLWSLNNRWTQTGNDGLNPISRIHWI